MATQPTNHELAKKIDAVDKKVDSKHKSLVSSFAKFRHEIRKELQPFHDYLVGQEAVEKSKKGGESAKIPSEVWGLLRILALIIAYLVGAKIS